MTCEFKAGDRVYCEASVCYDADSGEVVEQYGSIHPYPDSIWVKRDSDGAILHIEKKYLFLDGPTMPIILNEEQAVMFLLSKGYIIHKANKGD